MDGGAWQAIVHGIAKSWTQLKHLGMHTWGKWTSSTGTLLSEMKTV